MKTGKKIFSLVLAVIMVVSSLAISAGAANFLCEYLGHSFKEYVITTPPTCTTKGVETAYCARCDASTTREIDIDPTAHTAMRIPALAPTCTEYGYEAGIVCSGCDVIISGLAIIPSLGHTMGDFYEVSKSTCTVKGEEKADCLRCDFNVIRSIDLADHIDSNSDYKCDNNCGYEFEHPEPEVPDKPQEEIKENFFAKIIDLFVSFFDLIFSIFKK